MCHSIGMRRLQLLSIRDLPYLILNLVKDEIRLKEGLNDLVLENQQTLESVQETGENLFSEIERISRCNRSQFVASSFSQNHVTKRKLSIP